MTSSAHDVGPGPQLSARAYDVGVSDGALEIKLEDGRILHVLLAYFPRLLHATGPQRDNWQLIGRGVGIHWPDLDEDVSVENLLGTRRAAGAPSSGPRSPMVDPDVLAERAHGYEERLDRDK
jgi:hypothetical protein